MGILRRPIDQNNREMSKIAIVRGAFLNPFELQNYYPLKNKYELRTISSLHPISDNIEIPLTKTFSFTDLPNFPFKYQILNRLAIDIHYLFGLEQLLRGFDIAHVAETYYNYTRQAVNAKKRGYVKKVVSTVWEIIPGNNEGIWGRKRFKRIAREGVDHFIAVTELAKKALLEEGVDEEKATVIPMGVDLKRFQPATRHTGGKIVRILCVARLVAEKGIGELVEAFCALRKKYLDLELALVGEGPLKNKYARVPGIIFQPLPYQKIEKAYQEADIFCLPSKTTKYWQEQYGMALVEAMACGLPIVTTQTGAIGEVCGEAAVYAKPGDANDLQLKLERLITNTPARITLAKKARARAEAKYDHQVIAKQIDALYQKVLWE